MFDLLTSILDSQIDYQSLLLVIVVYLVALWLMFCLWVYIDAHRRYNKVSVAILMTALVFLFNFPALIFYLIVRPEEDAWVDYSAYDPGHGGVHVPVVHFTGEDGKVALSLNLEIHPQRAGSSDMTVDVGWTSDKQGMRLAERKEMSISTVKENFDSSDSKTNSPWDRLRNRAKSSIDGIQKSMSSSIKEMEGLEMEEVKTDNEEESNNEDEGRQNKKKKKNKKNKHNKES